MDFMRTIMEQFQISWQRLSILAFVLIVVIFSQSILKMYRWLTRSFKINQAIENFPGPKGHWFFGHALQIPQPGDMLVSWAEKLTLKYPRYNKFFMFSWMPGEVWLRHPDPVKQILKTSEPKSMSGGGSYALLKPWLGDGLLLSSGQKWFRNRKLLTPGFHFDVLKPYMAIYNQAANTLIGKLDKQSAHDPSVEIYRSVSLCTLDVMMRCAFSFQSDVQSSENKYVNTVNSLAELLVDRALKPWLYINRLYYSTKNGRKFLDQCDYAHQVAYELIDSRQKLLNDQPADCKERKYVDFLDILLLAKDEKGQGLTAEEIRQEVDTFLFEGHDTTASAISWLLYAMAKHPEIQQRCREEVQSLFEDASKTNFEWDDLKKIPYLTQCIKEGLRMYSPVPTVMRELTEPLDLDGHKILPGTFITLLLFQVHHNPLVWGDDHNEFKPERFHPDNMEKMDSHAFIPFSAGPRNCIGQNFAMHEIKVVVGRVLQHFELSVDENHQIERLPLLVMRAKYGIKLFFRTLH